MEATQNIFVVHNAYSLTVTVITLTKCIALDYRTRSC